MLFEELREPLFVFLKVVQDADMYLNRMRLICLVSLCILLGGSGCSLLEKKKEPDETLQFVGRELTAEEQKKLAGEVGGNFIYGQGLGDALISIGGIVLFPPYAIYVLGNGAISLAGYEPLYVTKLLPDKAEEGYNAGYSTVASGPGRLGAAIAGEEYRTTEVIRERYKKLLGSEKKVTEGR